MATRKQQEDNRRYVIVDKYNEAIGPLSRDDVETYLEDLVLTYEPGDFGLIDIYRLEPDPVIWDVEHKVTINW